MAAIAGRGGKVMQGANTLAFVKSWSLDIKDEALETTSLGATARSYIGRGMPENSCKIEFNALDNSGTGEAVLRAAALAGTSVALSLYESSTKYWAISSAFITGFSQSVDVEGLVTGSIDFTIAAAPVYT
jgi:hypothetical protein